MVYASTIRNLTAIAITLLAGCVSGPQHASHGPGPQGTVAYTIQVEADQPGVRIEANGEYVGMAPTVISVQGNDDGTFRNLGSFDYVIRAYPASVDHFPQVKVYRTGGWFTPRDKIPARVFFDTRIPPSAQPEVAPEMAGGSESVNKMQERDRQLAKQFEGYATAELKLRREQITEFLTATRKDVDVKIGSPLFMAVTDDRGKIESELREKNDIERELLRRWKTGDKEAELPLFQR